MNGAAVEVRAENGVSLGRAHHEVLRLDSKQVPEVTECNRSIGFKSKVTAVMSWRKVAALTEIIYISHLNLVTM